MDDDSLGNTIDGKKKLKNLIIKKRMIEIMPKAVLPSSLTEEIETEDVYIGLIKNRRDTSKAIKMISIAVPGFGHLKRCYGNRILLAPVNGFKTEDNSMKEKSNSNNTSVINSEYNRNFYNKDELKIFLKSRGFDLSLIDNEFEIKKIPTRVSRSKKQAKLCSKLWPVNFHPDPIIESLISGDIFNDNQLNIINILMDLVIKAARLSSIGNKECNGGALIIDPSIGSPLVLTSSKIDEHPLWHASMLAVDLVAKYQGGGAWNYVNSYSDDSSATLEKNKRKHDVNEIPLYYPKELKEIRIPIIEPLIDIKTYKINKIPDPLSNESLNNKNRPYLCTNYWVFLSQEPCALCAMALLHSRASKIFYGIDKEFGVLKTKAMLHTIPGLNHRYQVWSGVNENECQLLSRDIQIREIH